ncbi:hypothetical protein [Actinomadura violacea]|uniref:Uncharacterized protein n=1 Tax=Actinomadura violacea TaxID=2819934 RepID=A0ABS3RNN1_9ACTN|nr:hypothetical protein [Actinomadura violacea]MBO2458226.1 hypothetical protein [Actinomadura violacea]
MLAEWEPVTFAVAPGRIACLYPGPPESSAPDVDDCWVSVAADDGGAAGKGVGGPERPRPHPKSAKPPGSHSNTRRRRSSKPSRSDRVRSSDATDLHGRTTSRTCR